MDIKYSANYIIHCLIYLLINETITFIQYIFSAKKYTSYKLVESIIVYFLYFEFIALIIKYFKSNYHFPLRYFIYIGITALIRLIIVSHEEPMERYYTQNNLVLVIALYISNMRDLRKSSADISLHYFLYNLSSYYFGAVIK